MPVAGTMEGAHMGYIFVITCHTPRSMSRHRASQEESMFSSQAIVCSVGHIRGPDFIQEDTFQLCYCIEYSIPSKSRATECLADCTVH